MPASWAPALLFYFFLPKHLSRLLGLLGRMLRGCGPRGCRGGHRAWTPGCGQPLAPRPAVATSGGAARGRLRQRSGGGGGPGAARGGLGERKRATCSCDRGFDLHPGSGHSPFQGELERLGDTNARSPPGASSHWPLGVTSTYKLGRIEMQISFFSI